MILTYRGYDWAALAANLQAISTSASLGGEAGSVAGGHATPADACPSVRRWAS